MFELYAQNAKNNKMYRSICHKTIIVTWKWTSENRVVADWTNKIPYLHRIQYAALEWCMACLMWYRFWCTPHQAIKTFIKKVNAINVSARRQLNISKLAYNIIQLAEYIVVYVCLFRALLSTGDIWMHDKCTNCMYTTSDGRCEWSHSIRICRWHLQIAHINICFLLTLYICVYGV